MEPIAVYVHIPFCPSKCGYCDFNSYAMSGDIMQRTSAATIEEIHRSPVYGRPAKTIFFGGGTPTYIPPEQLLSILDAILEAHPPLPDCEITSEANPGTVDAARFRAMREGGFNRISLGAQSFQDSDLLSLERVHKASEINRAVEAAREAGFENINLDLMFALPGQSLFAWRRNLQKALSLQPDHLSLYCLTIEQNTAFYKKQLRGQLELPDDETQVAMYDECLAQVAKAGFEQYEISNFAKPRRECRHNLAYWHGEEYAGYGPGAVGCLSQPSPLRGRGQGEGALAVNLVPQEPSPLRGRGQCEGEPAEQLERNEPSPLRGRGQGEGAHADKLEAKQPSPAPGEGRVGVCRARSLSRYTNLKHPERYCAAVEDGAPLAFESEVLDLDKLRMERIMLGLRLNSGTPSDGMSATALKKVSTRGWAEEHDGRVRLTAEGRHFCSEVALELI